jgi:deferrochelatase/peroxidase EfeB
MTGRGERRPSATRRGFLAAAVAGGGASLAGLPPAARAEDEPARSAVEPFFGPHQAGIVTPAQAHAYFAAFDVTTDNRVDVAKLLSDWTDAAAKLAVGDSVPGPADNDYAADPDPAETQGLGPARLTLTFGFGAGLFVRDGRDRFGLAKRRPEAFVDLPKFPGDQLAPARTGGDLLVQACADNPQVAFHAVRTLTRLAWGVAAIRWVQAGFVSDYGRGETPRNLMGFKDGTGNPAIADAREMEAAVWVGDEGPEWMRGGSYVVIRRARMALEHWERTKIAFQEQTFGRRKLSGAPLGREHEFDPIDLAAVDADGNPIIPENSHVAIAHRAVLAGARVLRRSYSFNDGANMTAERWPPWRQGMEFDAGLVFVCFQRDPRKGFIPIFEKMSRFDMMNQFVTNTGGGLFAIPAGAAKGEFIGQRLFAAAA